MKATDLQRRRDDILWINLGDAPHRPSTTDLWQDGQGFVCHFPAENYHQICKAIIFHFWVYVSLGGMHSEG